MDDQEYLCQVKVGRDSSFENVPSAVKAVLMITSPSLRGIVLIWTKVSENFG